MINYGLPKTVEVAGVEYPIRSDYRAILDIISAINDPELSGIERARVVLEIFYEDYDSIPQVDWQEAVNKCIEFIGCGKTQNTGGSKTVNWEQDIQYIIAPINTIAGRDVRDMEYLHWWTFISYYSEISEKSTFCQIVRIRDRLANGKQLDKADKEWYRRNRDLVDVKTTYTDSEQELFKLWGG